MWTIRNVIQEAIYRANIVGRRQTIPDDKFEDALSILMDIASEFSNKNLLQWLRRSVEGPEVCKTEMTIGTISYPATHEDHVDIEVENPATITEVYYELNRPDITEDYNIPLQFVAYEDFFRSGYGSLVYSWQPTSDTQLTLYLKKTFVDMINTKGYGLKILYNQGWSFNENTEVRAPDIYRSLFLSALTYRLAVRFPRLSQEHTERLKSEMDDRINTLSSKTRANKLVLRTPNTPNNLCSVEQLMAGTYIFPR